ncbi:MAG TPA: glycosyltransferase, partial [Azonexus sp.]|nr:glycosyltransferase [Azonexus sp.]
MRLATAVAALGHPVELVFAKAAGECLARIPPDIRIIDLGASRPLTALPALVRYLRTTRPRVLAATITNANLVALWAIGLSGVPVRCLVREASTLSIDLKHTSAHNRFLLPRLINHTFRHADAIVTPSHGAADDLARVS